MNELLWLSILVINFFAVWCAKNFFGIMGMYVWMSISLIIANILVVIQIPLLGITATLGNVIYNANFIITDSLCETHDSKHARKAVWVGLFSMAAFTLIINLAALVRPAQSDWALGYMQELFALLPRVTLASLLAYLVAQFSDVWFFNLIKKMAPGRKFLWIRNNVSTLMSQLLDTAVFCVIALWGVVSPSVFLQICISTYIFKVIVAVLDTPFVYLLTHQQPKVPVEKLA